MPADQYFARQMQPTICSGLAVNQHSRPTGISGWIAALSDANAARCRKDAMHPSSQQSTFVWGRHYQGLSGVTLSLQDCSYGLSRVTITLRPIRTYGRSRRVGSERQGTSGRMVVDGGQVYRPMASAGMSLESIGIPHQPVDGPHLSPGSNESGRVIG